MSSFQDRSLWLHTGTSTVVDGVTQYTGFEQILARDFQPGQLEGDYEAREFATGLEGAQAEVLYNAHQRVRFGVEAAQSGAAGTAPAYDALLKACGLSAVTVADTSVTYSPTPLRTAMDDAVFQFRNGLMTQIVEKARGGLSFSAQARRKPVFSFDLLGAYRGPDAAVAVAAPDFSGWPAALECSPANVAAFTLGGTTLEMASFSFSDGRSPSRGQFVNVDETYIGTRRFTGRATVKWPALAAKDILKLAKDGTAQALVFTLGTQAGSILTITAPQCQVKFGGETDIDGELGANLDLVFQVDQGDDEILIAFT